MILKSIPCFFILCIIFNIGLSYKFNQSVNDLLLHDVSGIFTYHQEREEFGKVWKNEITNKWYYDDELSEIIGWSLLEKLKEK